MHVLLRHFAACCIKHEAFFLATQVLSHLSITVWGLLLSILVQRVVHVVEAGLHLLISHALNFRQVLAASNQ